MSDPTCEQRIADHLESRADTFASLFAAVNGGDVLCEVCDGTGETANGAECDQCSGVGEHTPLYDGEVIDQEDAYDRLAELPLSVEVKRIVRIDLSTGGPGDWIEASIDSDGDVMSVSYHFSDWFDHAERRVSEGSALWQAAEHYAEYVRGDA